MLQLNSTAACTTDCWKKDAFEQLSGKTVSMATLVTITEGWKKENKLPCLPTAGLCLKPPYIWDNYAYIFDYSLTSIRFPLTWAGSDVHKPRRQWTKNWPRFPYSLFTWKLKLPWEARWLRELFESSIWAWISTDKSTGQVFRNRTTRELSRGFEELEIQQFSVTTCTGTTKATDIK